MELNVHDGKTYAPLSKISPGNKRFLLSLRVRGLRKCSGCGIQKPDKEFTAQRSEIKNTGRCWTCKRISDAKSHRLHREERLEKIKQRIASNPAKYRKINRLAVSQHRFGLNRDVLIKDESQCESCGLTQAGHLLLYGSSLNIHHKDCWGRKALRYGDRPNNKLENLQILCVSCHTAEENRNHREYPPERFAKIWVTRRARYGRSGGN